MATQSEKHQPLPTKSPSQPAMGRPYDVHLLNWQLSVFWAFAGTVSLATCVSSTNKRLRAESERVKLQEQKVELLERVVRLQEQAKHQQKQLEQVEDLLTHSTRGWFGRQQLPYRDLMTVLVSKTTTASG